jgi:uncharacterized tellurite resistance protein B-like protein
MKQQPFETLMHYENAFLEIIEQLHYYLPFVASNNINYYRHACQANSQFMDNLNTCYDNNNASLYGVVCNRKRCNLGFRDIVVNREGLEHHLEIKRIFARFKKISTWFTQDYLSPMSQLWFGSSASVSAVYATMDKPTAQRCLMLMEYLNNVDMIYSRFYTYALVKRSPFVAASSALLMRVMACDIMFELLEREATLKIESDLFESILKTNLDEIVSKACSGQTKHLTKSYKRLLHKYNIFKQLRTTEQISSKEFK